VVEHSLGKGEAVSSILTGSTILKFIAQNFYSEANNRASQIAQLSNKASAKPEPSGFACLS
jgi:hypothetical protein